MHLWMAWIIYVAYMNGQCGIDHCFIDLASIYQYEILHWYGWQCYFWLNWIYDPPFQHDEEFDNTLQWNYKFLWSDIIMRCYGMKWWIWIL